MGVRDDEFWASFLGVDPRVWATRGICVEPHVGLRDYRGLWCFRHARRFVISAPAAWVPRLSDITADCDEDDLMRPSFWARVLSDDFDRAIGPAYQGCLAPAEFRPAPRDAVRPVDDADADALEEFRAACGSDWNMPDNATRWRHACVEEGAIMALAGYRDWNETTGDPCVITRPNARSGGRGTAVVSAVVAEALANERLLLYQTLESNTAAVRIASSLGYERYANHLAVRLSRESPARGRSSGRGMLVE